MAIPSEQYVGITSNEIGGTTGGGGAADSPGVSVLWGNILGDIQNQADLIALINQIAPEVEWGLITGDIADQADLQAVLSSLQSQVDLKMDETTAEAHFDTLDEIVAVNNLTPRLGVVASANGLPDYFFSQLRNIRSENPRRFDCRSNKIRGVYASVQAGSSGEQDIPGTLKLEAYVTIRGVSYNLPFSGKVVIDGVYGKIYVTDEITLPFYYDINEEFYETVQVQWTQAGSMYLVYRDSPQFFGFSGWASVFKNDAVWTPLTVTGGVVEKPAATGGFATTNDFNYFGAYYGAVAFLGETSVPTSVIAGDSHQKLAASQRFNSCIKNRWGITGEVASWCHSKGIPFLNLGWSGESYTTALQANKYTERKFIANLCGSILLDCYGYNDVGGGGAFNGTCTSTSTANVTGASVSGAVAAVGDFVEGPGLWPNTRIESGGGATFTLSRAPYIAITSFTLKRANTNTLSAWRSFITQFRTFLGWWDRPYLHNALMPRNDMNLVTGVRTASNATPTLNYFNWLLKTGQLSAPVDRGDGKFQHLIDGRIDGQVAVVENGDTGVFKAPTQSINFTSADGINTTAGSAFIQSTAGSFKPWMTGHIIYLEGAGGTNKTNVAGGSTTLRGYFVYLSPTWAVITLPKSTQDNTMTAALSYTRSTSTVNCNALTTLANINAYINNGDFDIDGLHYGVNGEEETVKNGNFEQLAKFY